MGAGHTQEAFWDQTPRTLQLEFGAAQMRATREHNERMSLAWHVAALQRAKRMPGLKTLLARTSGRTRQTWQQQRAVMGQWAVAMQRIDERRKASRKQAPKHARK